MGGFFYLHYKEVFFLTSMVICILFVLYYSSSQSCRLLLTKNSNLPTLILVILCILLFGFRQIDGDAAMYTRGYMLQESLNVEMGFRSEWFWAWISTMCIKMHLAAWQWIFLIAVGYVSVTYWACKKFLWENSFMAMAFYFCSYSFFSYGVNTLRSGFACAMLLVAFGFWIENKNKVACLILLILAFGTHRSCLLAIFAFCCAVFIIKTPKQAILVWCCSFVISLVVGQMIGNILVGLGFDERVSSYSITTGYVNDTYHSGFRLDFAAYSAAPIFLYWYVAIKKGIRDPKFDTLAITYILSNAIWLQFIRFAFTDRFAYLSWFMLPMVLAYASIRVPIWKDQDRKAAGILALEGLFTFGMYFMGKI